MDNELIKLVLKHARRGNDIFFGRSSAGGLKIKVKHGPFNVLTTRYKTNPTTFDAIRHLMNERRLHN